MSGPRIRINKHFDHRRHAEQRERRKTRAKAQHEQDRKEVFRVGYRITLNNTETLISYYSSRSYIDVVSRVNHIGETDSSADSIFRSYPRKMTTPTTTNSAPSIIFDTLPSDASKPRDLSNHVRDVLPSTSSGAPAPKPNTIMSNAIWPR